MGIIEDTDITEGTTARIMVLPTDTGLTTAPGCTELPPHGSIAKAGTGIIATAPPPVMAGVGMIPSGVIGAVAPDQEDRGNQQKRAGIEFLPFSFCTRRVA